MALKQYDEEFALMLYELQKDSVLYEHGLLFYLLLNPLTFNLDRFLILSKDIDPDAWLILIVTLEDSMKCYEAKSVISQFFTSILEVFSIILNIMDRDQAP